MRRWGGILLSFLLTGSLLGPAGVRAQQPQQKEDPAAKQESEKERRKRDERLKKELATPYKRWLSDEVAYIISDEERSAFLRLSTNEEREQFIEQFWLNRDPTPDTIENETKEEHYRRIAYANERYASGIPGWRTDRGKIYIIWGPPDEIESHPSGGSYDRPPEEGGGSTSTYPFEKWRYRYLEGIGNDIILEFVDPSSSGEYRMTMDPSEKDALLRIPNAGLTDLESAGLASKMDRFQRTDGTHLPTTLGAQPMRMNQFERLSQFAAVQRGPAPVRFKDLEEVVTSRIVRNQILYDYHFDFLRVTADTVLVPITIQVSNRQLSFQNKDGVHSAQMNLFCRISTLTGRVVQTFEDSISRDFPESLFQTSLKGSSIYQKAVPLRPGLYKLDIVLKDTQSGNVGVVNTRLAVPHYEAEKLTSSTLIIADQIERVPARQVGLGQFVLGASKVRPKLDHEFTTAEKLGIFLQVYNLIVDEKTHKTDATVEYRVRRGGEQVFAQTETSVELDQTGEQLTLEKLLNLNTFAPGKYKLEILITDKISGQTVNSSADFTVKAAAGAKTAAQNSPGG